MGPLRSSTVDQHDYDLSASNSTCINDNFTPIISSLLYLYLHFQDLKIAALFDSGSTTNLMSFALYNRLPNSVKSALKELSFDKIELANGSFISAWYSKGKSVCSSITQIYVCCFSCTGTDISACHSGHTVFATVRYFVRLF